MSLNQKWQECYQTRPKVYQYHSSIGDRAQGYPEVA